MCFATEKKFMNDNKLFMIDKHGTMYGFPVDNTEAIVYGGKWINLCSARNFIWGVDEQGVVNIFLNYEDASICIKEEIYENERWLPIQGFGKQRLPTDRYLWSNADGTVERKKDNVKLPSDGWSWEGNWNIEVNLNGVPTDSDGWTYALDFPNDFSARYFFPATVRKRKWYRYRRYVGLKKWIKLNPFYNVDGTKDFILNVSAGGQNYFDSQKHASLSLWAVTTNGNVLHRSGISLTCPEGTDWIDVSVPREQIKDVSCGANLLVWALNFEGEIFSLSGITKDNPIGKKWIKVTPPESNLKITQIAIGTDTAWAISSDDKLWFRANLQQNDIVASNWINVPRKMSCITVASDDSVWAVGKGDNVLYFKSSCYSGAKWKEFNIDERFKYVANSDTSVNDEKSENDGDLITAMQSTMKELTITDSVNSHSDQKSRNEANYTEKRNVWTILDAGSVTKMDELNKSEKRIYSSIFKLATCEYKFGEENKFRSCIMELKFIHVDEPFDKTAFLTISVKDKMKESFVQIQLNRLMCIIDESNVDFLCLALYIKHADNDHRKIVYRVRFYFEDEFKYWFSTLLKTCYRLNRINPLLIKSNENEVDSLSIPREGSLWLTTRSGDIYMCEPKQFPLKRKGRYVRHFKFEHSMPRKFTLYNGFTFDSIIAIHGYIPKDANRCSFNLVDVTGENIIFHLNPRFKENVIVLNEYINKTWGREERIHLNMSRENPFIISIRHLADNFEISINNEVCYNYRFGLLKDVITHLHVKEDVTIHNISYETIEPILSDHDTFWRKVDGNLLSVKSTYGLVTWGLSFDKQLWVFDSHGTNIVSYLRRIPDNIKNVLSYCPTTRTIVSECDIEQVELTNKMESCVIDYLYENQTRTLIDFNFHTSSSVWTDQDGKTYSSKNEYLLPSNQWKWITDWKIENNSQHDVDQNGWQYTNDVHKSPFHGKRMDTDRTRRRLWSRTRQITTQGFWKHLDGRSYKDFALSVVNSDQNKISGWAIDETGKVLFRRGVSRQYPMGLKWEPVPLYDIALSITLSSYSQVYVCSGIHIYYRVGITETDLIGVSWNRFKMTGTMKKIAVGNLSLWGLKENGKIFTSTIPASENELLQWSPLSDDNGIKFTDITAEGNRIWAVDDKGNLFCRMMVLPTSVQGIYWMSGLMDNCKMISF